MNLGLFVLRLVVGGLFIGHGTQKLFGWFQGHGLEGTGAFFENLGYRPGKRMAALAGLAETGAGALLVLGFLTPLAAAMIIGVMVNAMISVHAGKGMWATNGGHEVPLLYATVAAAFAFTGPGSWSVDNAIGITLFGVVWGLVTISVGLITGVIVSGFRREEVIVEDAGADRRRRAA